LLTGLKIGLCVLIPYIMVFQIFVLIISLKSYTIGSVAKAVSGVVFPSVIVLGTTLSLPFLVVLSWVLI
jgi:hypothetical protein